MIGVGDKVVCVDVAPLPWSRPLEMAKLRLRGVYTVASVNSVDGGYFLAELPDCFSFKANRFRKILPDKHEACESEFVDLLKRSKVPTETIVTVDRDGRAWMGELA